MDAATMTSMGLLTALTTTFLPPQWCVAIGASLVAAVIDLRSQRIPNRLTLPVLALGFLWACVFGGLTGLLESMGACLLVALPFVILFVVGGGGAGDAKLMGAIGAWLGYRDGIVALAAVCAAGAISAVVFSLSKGRLRVMLSNLKSLVDAFLALVLTRGRFRDALALAPPQGDMQAFPYGIAIFSGVTLAAIGVLLWSH